MCFAAIGAALGGLSGLGTIASIAGTAVSAIGSIQQGKAQAAAAQASADQNQRNAVIAQRNAEDARGRGVVAEQDLQLRTRARIGMQKNTLSERNIAANYGSALEILGDTAMIGKLDGLTTRNNFEREAISHEAQGMNFNAQAEQDKMAAKYAKQAGTLGAFSTVLGGVSSFAKSRAA